MEAVRINLRSNVVIQLIYKFFRKSVMSLINPLLNMVALENDTLVTYNILLNLLYID